MIKTGKYVYFENKVDLMSHIHLDGVRLKLLGVTFYEEQKPWHYPAVFVLEDEYIDDIKWVQTNNYIPIIDYCKAEIKKAEQQIKKLEEEMQNGQSNGTSID